MTTIYRYIKGDFLKEYLLDLKEQVIGKELMLY